jgi:hypothetical protein
MGHRAWFGEIEVWLFQVSIPWIWSNPFQRFWNVLGRQLSGPIWEGCSAMNWNTFLDLTLLSSFDWIGRENVQETPTFRKPPVSSRNSQPIPWPWRALEGPGAPHAPLPPELPRGSAAVTPFLWGEHFYRPTVRSAHGLMWLNMYP